MKSQEIQNCSTCKWRKSTGKCKESPREVRNPLDWCGAWKKKVGSR